MTTRDPPLKHLDEQAQITALQQQRNTRIEHNFHNDPLAHLPVEIASRIFNLCIPHTPTWDEFRDLENWYDVFRSEESTRLFHFTLGAVCHTWRHVVWSYSPFWTTIHITVRETTPSSRISIVKGWIDRAGSLPLVIIIVFKSFLNQHTKSVAFLDAVIPVLTKVAHRWSLLFARIPGEYVDRLHFQPNQPSILRGVVLEMGSLSTYRHHVTFDPGVEVSPLILSLRGYRLINVRIKWDHLMHFVGRALPTVEILELLHLAPQLVSYSAADTGSANLSSSLHLIHPNLEDLRFDYEVDLFALITLPSLRNLSFGRSISSFNTLCQFVSRSLCPLERITLDEVASDEHELISFLEMTNSLKSLDLLYMDVGELFFSRLTSTAYYHPNDTSTHFLPHLQHISFEGLRLFPWTSLAAVFTAQPPQENEGAIWRPLKKIEITSRSAGSLEPYIDFESLQVFLKVIDDGVDLHIHDDVRELDLIQASKNSYNSQGLHPQLF